MLDAALLGVGLGFGAGIAPGPLTGLVVTTALRRGMAGGARVAVTPLLTDAPIVVCCVLVVGAVPGEVAAVLGVGGGLFVVWLGLQALRDARTASLAVDGAVAGAVRADLLRGMAVNAASPHPWLFWLGVGAPILTDAVDVAGAAAFLVGFYALLVGVKVALAALVAVGRARLGDAGYRRALAASAVLLVAAGVVLVVEFWPA